LCDHSCEVLERVTAQQKESPGSSVVLDEGSRITQRGAQAIDVVERNHGEATAVRPRGRP
jgi:hypothetical protein